MKSAFARLGLLVGVVSTSACVCSVSKAPVSAMPAPVDGTVRAADLRAKTVALVRKADDGPSRPYCSGVWVSPTEILTAHHCVENKENVDYSISIGVIESPTMSLVAAWGAHVKKRDPAHDLALLETDGVTPSHPFANVAPIVQQGQHVYAMGHTAALWWTYACGEVSALRYSPYKDGVLMVQASVIPFWYGNSGGALYDDAGDVIGVASHLFIDSTRMGALIVPGVDFYVHRDHVAAFLAS